MSRIPPGKVYVILLNWNGWRDTIECLETVFRSTYSNFQVIVCDNNSSDDSPHCIQAWATGLLQVREPEHRALWLLSQPPVEKPIPYVSYDRSTAEAGGDVQADSAQLILIQSGANLGFAGGNNVGLRFALTRDDFSYIWILNNDTAVTPGALSALVKRTNEVPNAGLCGSTLLYYDAPEVVQLRGGVAYDRWFATMHPLDQGERADSPFARDRIEQAMGYPAGASMLVTRDFLRGVGLFSESYFLYYEELDWVTRAGGRFALAYSPDSLVYHKEGRSIASATTDSRFHVADYYAHRSRLRYTRRFFAVALPTVILRTFAAAFVRLWRGQPRRAWALVRLILSPATYGARPTSNGSTEGMAIGNTAE